ncbi:peptidoglycan binding domain-containing protein [Streptomyces dysideae]|uniref:Peptidoglycan binding domain-containing protein n=1 Tax=Streptomyces dysideae TaxID=909626 RepID=A0A124IE39_9ACTN|nr:peptidoglycan binding domain-containing protein [Streptomyces dysideae]KUO17091.1 hypothetical protein AQJ91_32910 [Streptomyces dysideae]
MSRETDTPSSGPNGHGGAAYPSGTPPYGTPMASEGGADAGRSATQSEERKTETTLTTRIRINIPGSRPIPPVVVRTPVADADGPDDSVDTDAPAPGATTSPRTVEAPAEPASPVAGEKASDWFAPRKSSPGKGGQGGASSNGAGVPGGSGAGASTGAGGRPGGVVGAMSVPGGSRPGGANGARPGGGNGTGLSGATGGPVAPGHGGGTGSFDVTEALAAGNGSNGSRPGGEPRRDNLPYFSENGNSGPNGPDGQGGYGSQSGPNGPSPYGGQSALSGYDGSSTGSHAFGGPGSDFSAPGSDFDAPNGPAGPTGGPVTGDGPVVPPVSGGMGGPTGMGAMSGRGPGGGLSDDTAILTPQKPAPEPGTPGYRGPAADNVSGHTVTSGIPVVPGNVQNAPFARGTGDGAMQHTAPKLPEPPAQSSPAASSAPKKKKGRSKLMLLTGGLVVIAGGVYGAGLLMNHSDVPKGTTVLGVDIGGGTRDDAVKKLNEAFDGRVNKALKLSVDGKTVTLEPDKAGLQFDMQATVSQAAGSDYNPVSVIGSLFGQQRVVEPTMPVDEEKLQAALENAAGDTASSTDGTVQFKPGKAVAVYGKAGKGVDVTKSTDAVEEAYRTQVETGTSAAVPLATTTKQPTVTNAEVDRFMKEFAEPAMSANVTVQTDAAGSVPVPMSPQNSIWKFLKVKAVDGKLVDAPDLTALKDLYGGAFDGVKITRANGKKTPVTPEDVYVALREALKSKTDRVAIIETNPN